MKLAGDNHFEAAAQKFLHASNLKAEALHSYERYIADGLLIFVEGTQRTLQQILEQLEAQKPKAQVSKVKGKK